MERHRLRLRLCIVGQVDPIRDGFHTTNQSFHETPEFTHNQCVWLRKHDACQFSHRPKRYVDADRFLVNFDPRCFWPTVEVLSLMHNQRQLKLRNRVKLQGEDFQHHHDKFASVMKMSHHLFGF
jgi:hypothetical protein